MPDLSTLFNNLGPAGGSILAGVQMGNEANKAAQDEQLAQARLAQIVQETKQAETMNPLIAQAKQQEIAGAALKQKAQEHDFHTQLLGEAIPMLQQVPDLPGQRIAALNDYVTQRGGHALTPEDMEYYGSQKDLIGTLKKQHEWAITQSDKYRTEMDRQALHNQGTIEAARIGAKSREAVANSRQHSTDIVSQVQAGKLTPAKAAVAFDTMAAVETDPEQKQLYQQQAARYEQLAAKLAAAGGMGRPTIVNGPNGPTLGTGTYEPALGAPAVPAPTTPQLPTGWSVK